MSAIVANLRKRSWPHPEWWCLSLSGVAWVLIFWSSGASGVGVPSPQHMHHPPAALHSSHAAWSVEIFWWVLMIVAMMFPMVIEPVRTTAARSLWRLRHRAIFFFLLGYSLPWMMFALATFVLTSAVGVEFRSHAGAVAAIAFGIALVWQFTSLKRRALVNCHVTHPIASRGWRASRDCVHYGWLVGRSCLISCWALMLACMMSGHSIAALAGCTAIGWTERNQRRPNQWLLCGAIAVLAILSFLNSLP